MKRTNVILDERLLKEAKKLSGERTYSATINAALKEMIRTLKVREGLKMMSGSGWDRPLHTAAVTLHTMKPERKV